MSPANFHEEDRRVLNGPRPSPLRISKDSHVIQKPSSSYSMPMNISSQIKVTKQQDYPKLMNQHQRQPVIIYTRSPKIIHTKPRDFMALVQKLTGFSRSETQIPDQSQENRQMILDTKKDCGSNVNHEDNDSSCVSSDEKNEGVNPYMAEIPLFTPNSSNLFFSPQGLFRHPDVVVSSPSIVGSFSPSFLEFLNMKELPEY